MSKPFPKFVITKVTYLADHFERSRSFIVPSRIFFNVPETFEDGNELISEPAFRADHPRLRSMSVGDVVTFLAR